MIDEKDEKAEAKRKQMLEEQAALLTEIQRRVTAIPGITIDSALDIMQRITEYGGRIAGDTAGLFIGPILGSLIRSQKPKGAELIPPDWPAR